MGTRLADAGDRVFDDLRPLDAVAALPVPLAHPDGPRRRSAGRPRGPPSQRAADRGTGHDPDPGDPAHAGQAAHRGGLCPRRGRCWTSWTGCCPGDWRVTWYRAVAALGLGDPAQAVRLFDACVSLLPGEIAPRLGLAFALECAGQNPVRWYESVWRTDHGYVSAAFGLARNGLTEVLDEVPVTSSHRVAAQIARVAATSRGPDPTRLGHGDLAAAVTRLEQLARPRPAPPRAPHRRGPARRPGPARHQRAARGAAPGGRPVHRAGRAPQAGGDLPRAGRRRAAPARSATPWSTRPTRYVPGRGW